MDMTDLPECRLRIFHVNDVYLLDYLPSLKTCIDLESSRFAQHAGSLCMPEDRVAWTDLWNGLTESALKELEEKDSHGRPPLRRTLSFSKSMARAAGFKRNSLIDTGELKKEVFHRAELTAKVQHHRPVDHHNPRHHHHATYPNSHVLTTLSGDFLAPSLLSSIDHGRSMVALMNQLPIDAVCFGNHESDVPFHSLLKRIHEFNGKWLNSNMPKFEPQLPDHHIMHLHGRDVALLGLCVGGGENASLYRPGVLGGYAATIVPVLEAAEGAIARARADAPNATVIALTHQDSSDDIKLALKGGISVILGGHDHKVANEKHGDCYVVKAGSDARQVAIVDLVWAAGELVPKVSVRMEPLTRAPPEARFEEELSGDSHDKYGPDPTLTLSMYRWQQPEKELRSSTLGEFPPNSISSRAVRSKENSMARMIATAMRTVLHADCTLMNSGGVRGDMDYPTGRVTYADLKAECPFASSVVVVTLPGSVLSAAVQESRRPWDEGKESGLSFQLDDGSTCDPTTHAMLTVKKAPFDPARFYRTVVDAFMVDANSVLHAYLTLHPEHAQPQDAGLTPLALVVSYFCDKAWRKLLGNGTDQQVEGNALSRLDKNGDGFLDEDEVAEALVTSLPGMASRVLAKQCLAMVAKNGEGKVDLASLKARFAEEAEIRTA